jgi:hypothetical protein
MHMLCFCTWASFQGRVWHVFILLRSQGVVVDMINTLLSSPPVTGDADSLATVLGYVCMHVNLLVYSSQDTYGLAFLGHGIYLCILLKVICRETHGDLLL